MAYSWGYVPAHRVVMVMSVLLRGCWHGRMVHLATIFSGLLQISHILKEFTKVPGPLARTAALLVVGGGPHMRSFKCPHLQKRSGGFGPSFRSRTGHVGAMNPSQLVTGFRGVSLDTPKCLHSSHAGAMTSKAPGRSLSSLWRAGTKPFQALSWMTKAQLLHFD